MMINRGMGLSDVAPITEHPAKYNKQILGKIGELIDEHYPHNHAIVLDPFGGIGGIHDLTCERVRVTTLAGELQPGWAAASAERGWTWWGDWLKFDWAQAHFEREDPTTGLILTSPPDIIATSPSYGNRMADKHKQRPEDDSRRITYAHTLRRNGEALHPASSGGMQWGDRYREFHRKAWRHAAGQLGPRGLLILNVKDHIRGGKIQMVSDWHRDVIEGEGFEQVVECRIGAQGMGFGENQTLDEGVKVDYERVYVFRKRAIDTGWIAEIESE